MEKRRKKDSRKSKKFSMKETFSSDLDATSKFLGVDNCISIYLSPQTQRYIGCEIGENITAEKPWIYVRKERIEDNLFLHENSSEFLLLRNIIEEYPADNMLIGSYKTNPDRVEEFMICTTIEAQEKIFKLLEKEKQAVKEKVKKLIYCLPRKWKSRGSEEEVNASHNLNNRKLFAVIVDSQMPISVGTGKIKFKYRLAHADEKCLTYNEILPDRYNNRLVFKFRVDTGSQITPIKRNIEVQTLLTFPVQKSTQTNEVFLVMNLTEEQNVKLKKGLTGLLNLLEDRLQFNFHINLYKNDYKFANSFIQSHVRESKELINFQDVINCKDLCYGSTSWNPLISGLLAVSYVRWPRKLIVNQDYLTMTKLQSPSFQDGSLVLIWCYSDNLSPKLYIHVNFEITCISFCPYDENILVGGGSGGQIVIWDLKNKLKEVEEKEYLTTDELSNRNIVRSFTSWIKWPEGVRHVFPTIISDIALSHKSPVISIEWLPSYHRLTKLGKVEDVSLREDHTSYLQPWKSYQFLTCSTEDSSVLAWEIKTSSYMLKIVHPKKKKNRRLTRLPEALIQGISPLTKFNKNFKPFFKLKLELPGKKEKQIFVTNFVLNNPRIEYRTLNPSTMDNLRERTYFSEIVPEVRETHKQKFVFCSTSGYLAECQWSANEFDQGNVLNEQVCETKEFLAIHDGPILSCQSNRFYPECILTIGGSVFAVWITSATTKPIFWRKGDRRYVSGVWSLQYPLFCLVLREDNYMECWDLVDCATKPLRKIKLKGSQIIDVISDMNRNHARKKTYLLTDIRGAIRVQDRALYNTLENYQTLHAITVEVLNNVFTRKRNVENLNERLKKEHNFNKSHLLSPETFGHRSKSELHEHGKHLSETYHLFRETKWQRREELRMFETLLQQKKIDMGELRQNMTPLMEKLNKRLKQQKKIEEKLSSKEKVFDSHIKYLLEGSNIVRRQKITITFPKEMQELMKNKYMEEYKIIEKETIENIGKASQRITVNWKTVLGRQKPESSLKKNISKHGDNELDLKGRKLQHDSF